MVVGHRNRERVIIYLPRYEIAHDEIGALEYLVHGWWLVHPPGDRLEVGDVEGIWIEAAVPADHIERMLRHHVPGTDYAGPGAVFDEHLHVRSKFLQRLVRAMQIAFTVRRMLQQLAELGQVSPHRAD